MTTERCALRVEGPELTYALQRPASAGATEFGILWQGPLRSPHRASLQKAYWC